MNTTTTSVRSLPARGALALSADAWALVGLMGIALVLVGVTWETWGDLGRDTGYDLSAAGRIADGEVPYVDFTYYYGPLAPGLLGGRFWLFGTSMGTAIAYGIVLSLAIAAATYALARTQTGPIGSFLAAAITTCIAFAPTNLSFVVPHSYSAPLAILLALVFLLTLAQFARTQRAAWLVSAGASVGLVAVTRPEYVVAVVAAAACWIGARALSRDARWRDVALLATPAVALPVLVYGAFAIAVGPRDLVWENVYPADELEAAGNTLLRSRAPLTPASFLELGGRFMLYALGVVLLVLLARVVDRRLGRSVLPVALAVGTAFATLAVTIRPETLRYWLQFAYGWIPLGAPVFVGYLIWRHRTRLSRWSSEDQVALALAVLLTVLAAKVYGAFFVQSVRPQHAVYAIPFATIFIARFHLVELSRYRSAAALGAGWLAFLAVAAFGLTLKDASAESATVHGVGGALAARPAEARAYQGLVTWVERNVRPGRPILVAPQLTWLYTFAERPSPLHQLSLLPGSLVGTADQQAVIDSLRRENVRVAVVDRRRYTEYGHTSFGDSFGRRVDRWIRQRFARAEVIGPVGDQGRNIEIWVRREGS
jgi:hypothetical protein